MIVGREFGEVVRKVGEGGQGGEEGGGDVKLLPQILPFVEQGQTWVEHLYFTALTNL